jgi:hypothetical protein
LYLQNKEASARVRHDRERGEVSSPMEGGLLEELSAEDGLERPSGVFLKRRGRSRQSEGLAVSKRVVLTYVVFLDDLDESAVSRGKVYDSARDDGKEVRGIGGGSDERVVQLREESEVVNVGDQDGD